MIEKFIFFRSWTRPIPCWIRMVTESSRLCADPTGYLTHPAGRQLPTARYNNYSTHPAGRQLPTARYNNYSTHPAGRQLLTARYNNCAYSSVLGIKCDSITRHFLNRLFKARYTLPFYLFTVDGESDSLSSIHACGRSCFLIVKTFNLIISFGLYKIIKKCGMLFLSRSWKALTFLTDTVHKISYRFKKLVKLLKT